MKMKKKSNTESFWNTKDVQKFVEKRTKIHYDDWQWEYAKVKGNLAARIGRQSGKSEGEALRLGEFSLNYKPPKAGLHLLITGGVERQAYELYQKVKRFIEAVAPEAIKGRATQKKLELKSGFTILALPCGRDGAGLRNYAAAKIAVDEAHYVPDEVYVAIEPMLLSTMGTMDLISTTRGDKGFFREAFRNDSGYATFHFKTKEVIENRKICDSWTEGQRDFALEFIEKKKKAMTKNQFKQEFEAEFLDSLQQIFTLELLDSCVGKDTMVNTRNYLGIDLAGYGGDENAFVSVKNNGKKSFLFEFETSERVKAWETVNKIIDLNDRLNYKEIGVDDGGLGAPILDYILTNNKLKRKTRGLNNASRSIDADGRGKRLLKEDMYGNLKIMMEQGLIKFEYNEKLFNSLLSIQFEINPQTGNVIIFGNDSHVTEAFIRAMWLIKSKGLSILAFC